MAESRVFKLMNGVTLEMLGEAVEGFLRDSKGIADSSGQTTGGYLTEGRQELTAGRGYPVQTKRLVYRCLKQKML